MINKIILFSLQNKYFILLCTVILVALGIRTATRMDIDVFPDLTAPTVVIMTDAPGMASEEVERLITFPIETAMNGATDVRRVRSTSSHGYSFVWIEFDWGTDIFKARQIVSERLMAVSENMPLGAGQPALAPQSSVMGEIFFIGMKSDTTSLMDLRTIAEWQVKPALLAITGVSQVTVIGGGLKQYQIIADQDKMNHLQVSTAELERACQAISQNSTGGLVREYGNEYVVRGIARTADLEVLRNSLVKYSGSIPVRISDVATIRIDEAVRTGYASQNGHPSVILSISKQPGINTLNLTEEVEKNLVGISNQLHGDIEINSGIFRQADFIETSIGNVRRALLEGAFFVVIILFLFLGSIRTTIISLLAIPLSLLGTIITLNVLGLNINTMSLGGMAIAVGVLVDDAIIDVENVFKRLRQNFAIKGTARLRSIDVVFEASKEIRPSIINATMIIIAAFMPLFFLSGMEGRMLKPLGIAFIVSLFTSLIVALTLTPLLCNMMLSGERYLTRNQKENRIVHWIRKAYERSLLYTFRHKRYILIGTGLVFVLSLVLLAGMGRSFLPDFNEGSLTISAVSSPGISLEVSNQIGNTIEQELLEIPEVISTARRTGRGELDEHSQSTNSAEIDVKFRLEERDREDFMADVRNRLSGVPGIVSTVGQPLGHRIDHMLSGTKANIAIKIFGVNLTRLYSLGKEIESQIEGIEGLVDLSVEQQTEVPQIQIRANRNMLLRYGIPVSAFNDFVETALGGKKMADIYEGQSRFDLVLSYAGPNSLTMQKIRDMLLDTGDGLKVPLSQIADIRSASGPSAISRENVQRKIVVSANVAGRDLRSVVNDIRNTIENNVIIPEGYRVEYGGQFEAEAVASRTLLITSLLIIAVIFLLLYQEFRDFQLSGIILLNLPLSWIGGVFAIAFTSGIISIPSIIGFITLFGIATRNGILLVSHYKRLLEQGTPLQEAILQGSSERLNPILMTALTAALALIPLAMRGNAAGNEIQSPMAKVILGGLLSSTLLNIYIIPLIFSLLKIKGSGVSEEYS